MTTPVISVYNRSTASLGLDLAKLVAAMQAYVDGPLAAAWGVSAHLELVDQPIPGSWGLIFLDTADVEGALAYHTDEGLPLSKVFVKTVQQAGESLSVSATHELAEMLVDPGCNQFAMNAAGVLYTFEVADAVEETHFNVDGFDMSDFCYPAWFGQPGAPGKFDHCDAVSFPFTLAKGGYCTTIQAGQMKQVFGSDAKATKYAAQDRRGRRGMLRIGNIDVSLTYKGEPKGAPMMGVEVSVTSPWGD